MSATKSAPKRFGQLATMSARLVDLHAGKTVVDPETGEVVIGVGQPVYDLQHAYRLLHVDTNMTFLLNDEVVVDLVRPSLGCPECGQREVDRLVFCPSADHVTCVCGAVYNPSHQRAATCTCQ